MKQMVEAQAQQSSYQFARAHPKEFLFAANEVPDLEDAPLKLAREVGRSDDRGIEIWRGV
jgi:hypothetical protein